MSEASSGPVGASVAQRAIEAIYPLSPAQQGMLFHSVYQQGSRSYCTRSVYRLQGLLDVQAFRRAWLAVLARHEALRAAFLWQQAERPVQAVLRVDAIELPWQLEDWSAASEEEQLARLAALLERDHAAGFELARPPLARLALARLGADAFYFVFSHHHLVLDGWSHVLVLRDVLRAYAAECAGAGAELGPAPRYRDFIAWLGRQDRERARAYWQRELGSGLGPTPLPGDRAGALEPADRAHDEFVLRFSQAQTHALRERARQCAVTQGSLLQAAWALALGRCAGTRDVVLGVALSGRPAELPGAEAMVGLLINSLPLRVRWGGATRVEELLRALHAQGAALREHEWSALVDVQRWCESERLFDNLLVFDNFPMSGLAEPAALLRAVPLRAAEQALVDGWSAQRNHYPLTLVAVPGGELQLRLAVDRRRFSAQRARALLAAVGELALQLARAERVGELALAPAPAPAAVLPGPAAPLLECIAAHAARQPQAPALLCAGQTLAWGELERRSRSIALQLRARGVAREARVALWLPRGIPWVVGMLGVLRAGGCYVPLDAQWPERRAQSCARDAGARLAITADALRAQALAAGVPGLRAIAWSELERAAEAPQSAARELPDAHPLALAYVLYTSGSSGAPKGVAVTHVSLADYAASLTARAALPPASRWAWLSSPAADLGNTSVFGALAAGGSLWIAAESESDDADRLAARMDEARCGALKIAPSQLLALLGAARAPERLLPHQLLVLGGEPLLESCAQRVRALRPGCRILNHYGPTETTIGVAAHELGASAPLGAAAHPIGAPLAHASAALLDPEGRPVADELPGELCIGGSGLARGYWGQPALTAARFVPDPHAAQPGARLYRSGDRMYRRGGALHFLGRIDAQLKLRGQRVEPQEIERALLAQPGVAGAAAVLQDAPTGARLVAFVVPAAGAGFDAQALRKALAEELPGGWLPALFAPLRELPLLPSGKLDRAALRTREPGQAAAADESPRSELESQLARIWQAVLSRERIGVHANFFELGGDSILSLQLVARARREGLRFTPKQLFDHPSIARLAAELARSAAAAAPAAEPRADEAADWPLVPVQRWFFELALAERNHFNQSLLLALRAAPEQGALCDALAVLVRRHSALRSRFALRADGWRQRLAPAEAAPALRWLSLAAPDPTGRAAQLERACGELQRSLDLEAGPVFAVLCAVAPPGAQPAAYLFFAAHHLVIDAVSWRIALGELRAALAGEPLGPLPGSFAQASAPLHSPAAAERALAQLPFWRRQLEPAPLQLASGADERENLYRWARSERAALGPSETAALERELARTLRGTLRDAALYAVARALARAFARSELAVEIEGHGREPFGPPGAEAPAAVGWFTARYPLALACDPAAPPLAAFGAVAAALRAVPDGGVGYGVLRYLTAAGGELAARPAPQLAFNYLGEVERGIDRAWLAPCDVELEREGEAPAAERDPQGRRPAWFSVTAQLAGGALRLRWGYGARLHGEPQVRALAQGALAELRELLRAAQGAARPPLQAWQVPLSGLGDAELAGLALDAREVEDVLRCAPLQEGLWVQSLRARGTYVNQWSAELQGLDADALRAAWSQLAERHAVLRTALVWEPAQGGQLPWPVQVVWRRLPLPVRELDWSELGAQEQAQRWERELALDREQGYALERAPLWRVLLARCGQGRWRLLWSRHHVLLDGWSSARLLGEWLRLYAAAVRGEAAALQPVPPYREYIRWLAGRSAQASERYWAQELASWSGATPLPLAEPLAAGSAQAGAAEPGELLGALAAPQWDALQRFAAALGVTPNTVCQGAWGLLLARASGARDVWFGATVSARPAELAGAERMVGLLIQSLPLRVSCAPEPSIAQWLLGVQARASAQREHESTPLGRLRSLAPRGPDAGAELFESLLVYENYPLDEALAGAAQLLQVQRAHSAERTHYPLVWVLAPGIALRIKLQYARERYSEARARQLLELYTALLERLVRLGGSARLGCVGLLDELPARAPAARPRPAARWSAGETLVSAFRAAAQRRPEGTALRCGGASLSYADLDARSSALARGLRLRGVRAESRVGLSLEPSPERVIALLGILKAGGCYVPLEPEQPAARQQYALRDAGARWLLGACGPQLGSDCALLEPAELEGEGAASRVALPEPRAEQLAYAIYTSGSTGQPKGVGVEHRQVLSLFAASEPHFGFGAADVWPQFHSQAFDFSVWELWGALLYGGCALEVPRALRRDPAAFLELLRAARATVLNQTPSAFAALADAWLAAPESARPRSLRWLIFGGEALERRRVERWLREQRASGLRAVNMYGITETTVHVTVSELREPAQQGGASGGIGEPLAGWSARALDAAAQPAPPGVWAELWVGGAGVARGYLGRPGLTAQRFAPDPWGPPGSRAYRSGDLGRVGPGGELEYGGRLDRQLKLRGFRIEPGEIESALCAHPSLRAAAVRLRARAGGEGRLVAYVVPVQPDAPPSAAQLREWLGARLPEYMVPAAYATVPALPLTPNGKLDEAALPAPAPEAAAAEPRDALQRRLAQLWAQLLELERVGPGDDFFELGGHSLAAVRLLGHCRQEFGRALELAEIFELRTLERLAERIRSAPALPARGEALAQAAALLDALEAAGGAADEGS